MQKQTYINCSHFTVLQTTIIRMQFQKSENKLNVIYTPKLISPAESISTNVTLQERSKVHNKSLFFLYLRNSKNSGLAHRAERKIKLKSHTRSP